VSGLGFLGGRPRLRLGGGSALSSSAFLLGGLPRFLLGGSSPAASAVEVPDFLFFEPLGRPLPRLGGASVLDAGSAAVPGPWASSADSCGGEPDIGSGLWDSLEDEDEDKGKEGEEEGLEKRALFF